MNLWEAAVSKYYSGAQTETFIWAALSLRRHFIRLTEEHVSAICNSPFKGHRPAFVEHFEEPLFPSLEKPAALALSQTVESEKRSRGRQIVSRCCTVLQCWYSLLWKEVEEFLPGRGSRREPSVMLSVWKPECDPASSLHLSPLSRKKRSFEFSLWNLECCSFFNCLLIVTLFWSV